MKAPLFFLTGMPGAGKSYWARKLAAACGIAVVDMDQELEKEQLMRVTEVFTRHGEAAFRELERDLLHRLIDLNVRPMLVACGGGVPCFFDNMERMREAGQVVYLQAEIATLEQRLRTEPGIRPLLRDPEGLVHRLQDLLRERSAYYSRADYIFEVETLSLTNFTEIIEACTNRH